MDNNSSKKIVSGISWSFAEKILTDLISTIITIVLARLLLPEDYGLVALVTIFINISSIFVSTGLGAALIQKKDVSESQYSTIFYTNLTLGILLYLILYALAPTIARFRNNMELVALFRVLAIKVPVISVYNIQHAYIKKRMEFKKFFYSSFAGTIISGFIGIFLAYRGYGAWALVVATLTDGIMDSIILFFTTKWLPKFNISFKDSKTMLKFGMTVLLSEFLGRIYGQLRSLIIGVKYSSSALAYSTKGQKFPQMIVDITNSTIIRVIVPAMANVQNDRKKMKQMVKTTVKIQMFFILPLMIGMISTANRTIPLLLTNNWVGAIPYMQVFCVVYMLEAFCNTDSKIAEALGKGKILLIKRAATILVSLLIMMVSLILFDNAIYLVFGILFSEIISVFIIINISNKLINYGLLEHIKDISRIMIIAAIMGILVYYIGIVLPYNDLIVVTIQVITGIAIYTSLSFIFKLEQVKYILDYIKNKQ